jgi:hypothetical protein
MWHARRRMQRLHLVELEDLPWVPKPIRDGGTDVLDFAFARVGFYRPLLDELIELIDATGGDTIIDVCSGGGGGALSMHALLRERGRDIPLTLTERYPNAAAIARVKAIGDVNLTYHERSVDAFAVPVELRGIRTMFGALHHFRPDDVQRFIAAAVADGTPIALFDVAASPVIRKLPVVLLPLLAVPNLLMMGLITMIVIPFVRPFRWSRLLLTYVLPAIPALFAWDGTVSALRAYSPDELLVLARAVPGGDSYDWSARKSGTALCLIGRPK